MFYKSVISILLTLAFFITASPAPKERSCVSRVDAMADTLFNHVKFLPEYHLDANLYTFFLQRNAYFKERYYLESDPKLSFAFLSINDFIYSVWDFEFQFGMGQTPNNVVFDPMDVNFGIIPMIELRFKPLITHVGIEHRCYHEIDRRGFPTAYNNKLFIAVGSPNMRQYDYWLSNVKGEWILSNQLSTYVRWGYFAKEFFGLVDPLKINGESARQHELSVEMRYAFYKRKSWFVNVRLNGLVGQNDSTVNQEAYWRQDISIESNFSRGLRGGMLFLTYTLDDIPLYHGLPRFSRNELLQAGVRFYY